jgi:hypothetical protein
MTTLTDIDSRARLYADARENLCGIVTDLTAAIEAIKRQTMPELKRAVARAAGHHDELKALIDSAPGLFKKPKTLTLHGIRLGYAKSKGSVKWKDADAVVEAIREHLPEKAEWLIQETPVPVKTAIAQLSADEQKRIGCDVTEAGDQIVIKPVDSEVDKLVDALLKEATETGEVA